MHFFLLSTSFGSNNDAPKKNDDEFDFLYEDECGKNDEENKIENNQKVADPLCYFNKKMFYFNDKFYIFVLRPVSKTYSFIVPKPLRNGIKNFFHNLKYPLRFLSCILQFKFKKAGKETGAFLLNTSLGFFGFAKHSDLFESLKVTEEDLGQVLGFYGAKEGFYIVLPILGPSTLRDGVSFTGSYFIPYANLNEVVISTTEEKVISGTVEALNGSEEILNLYYSLKEASIEPYEAFKDAYIQRRNNQIKD